jgi:hypothetical protein
MVLVVYNNVGEVLFVIAALIYFPLTRLQT